MYLDLNLDENCPICWDSLKGKEIYIGSCGHAYCLECRTKIQVCPECREYYDIDIKLDLEPTLFSEIESFFSELPFDIKEIRLTAAAIFSCSVNYFIKNENEIDPELQKMIDTPDYIETYKFEYIYSDLSDIEDLKLSPEDFFFYLLADIFFGYLRENFPDFPTDSKIFKMLPVGVDLYQIPKEESFFFNHFRCKIN